MNPIECDVVFVCLAVRPPIANSCDFPDRKTSPRLLASLYDDSNWQMRQKKSHLSLRAEIGFCLAFVVIMMQYP